MTIAATPAPSSFDDFYRATYTTAWHITSADRARIFHGGEPCPQSPLPPPQHPGSETATCCASCTSAVDDTIVASYQKWLGNAAGGHVADPVEFVRENAKHRFSDAHEKAEYAAHNALHKPKRAVYDSMRIDEALDGDDQAKLLLYLMIRFVQGNDEPEPGSLYPYRRWAARLGYRGSGAAARVAREVDELVSRLRARMPRWVEKHIDRHTRQFAKLGGLDLRPCDDDDERRMCSDVADPKAALDDELLFAAGVLRRARAAYRHGVPAETALRTAIREVFGDAAERDAVKRGASSSSSHWPELVASVTQGDAA